MDFAVAIGEREAAGAVMIRGRHIIPGSGTRPEGGWRHVQTKQTVINAVRMFIHKHPGHGRAGPSEFALSHEHFISCVAIDSVGIWRVRALRIDRKSTRLN